MSLEVEFTITETKLLFQQNPLCQVVLRNSGVRPVTALNPVTHPNMPILRVLDLKTGTETVHKRKGAFTGDLYKPLGPGESWTFSFALLEYCSFPAPGNYEIVATILAADGKHPVESEPVRLEILPVTPRNLSTVTVQGGWANLLYGTSVNVEDDPPRILRYSFAPDVEGGVVDVHAVGAAPLRADAALSAPANNSVAHDHWIAWAEGDALKFVHLDRLGMPTKMRQWTLPDSSSRIVKPLHIVPGTGASDPMHGAVMICSGAPAGRRFRLQAVTLPAAGKAVPGASVDVDGPLPEWIKSHERSDGTRFLLRIGTEDGALALRGLPWSDQGIGRRAQAALATWQGRSLGAGTCISNDDTIHGAILRLEEQPGSWVFEWVRWSIDKSGAYSENGRQAIDWPYAKGIDRSKVSVGPRGAPAALITDDDGKLSICTADGKVSPAPLGLETGERPVEIFFLKPGEPGLIAGRVYLGFKMMRIDGSPLPASKG